MGFFGGFFFLLLATHILYGLEQSNKLRPYFLGGEELPLAVELVMLNEIPYGQQ